MSKLKFIRTRVKRQGRKRIKTELKTPLIKQYSVSLMLGKASNKIYSSTGQYWKGFDDQRFGLYLQYKTGKQLLAIKNSSLFGLLNPTILFENYTTNSVWEFKQESNFLGIGLAAELSLIIKTKQKRLYKISFELGILGYNYFSLLNNNPYLLNRHRRTHSVESRLSPSMYTLKFGVPIKKLKS